MRRCLFPFTLTIFLLATASAPAQQNPTFSRDRDLVELETAIWRSLANGTLSQSEAHSRRLLEIDPGNALASAALLSSTNKLDSDAVLSLGRSGLNNVERLSRIPSMSEDEFLQMTRRVRIILNSAVGRAYVDRGDQVTARKYLKEAVALDPGNARHAYIAGQAFLNGKHPDLTVGYWLLARTVVLTQGTKEGDAIARYAYSQYMSAGGKREDWGTFLARATQAAPPIGIEVAAIPAGPVVAQSQPSIAPPALAQNQEPVASASVPGSVSAAPSRSQPAGTASSSQPVTQQGSSSSDTTSSSQSATQATTNSGNAGVANGATVPASPPPVTQQGSASSGPTSNSQNATQATTNSGNTVIASAATVPGSPKPRSTATTRSDSGGSVDSDLGRIEQSLPTNGAPAIESGNRSIAAEEGRPAPELPVEIAENRRPDLPPSPAARPKLRGGAPLSIGVLIQARIASRENRRSVIYALSDMLRRLRENDEAFLVSYGSGVGMEQDLTWNYDLLEKAMDRIGPEPGSQLYDAVEFSAGHLGRVAKNPDRVLIVISDGTSDVSTVSSLELDSELRKSDVRIYCVGIGVNGSQDRWRLENLATRYGGEVRFVPDPTGFRPAIHAIAAELGIEFQE